MKPLLTGSPGCWVYVYGYNFETTHYHVVSQQIGALILPERLKIEPTQRRDIKQRAKFLIRSKGNEFYTGLLPTDYPGYFAGDHKEKMKRGKEKKSFVLFNLSPDQLTLTIYHFRGWYPVNREHFLNRLFQ